jgi:hypothetical protein
MPAIEFAGGKTAPRWKRSRGVKTMRQPILLAVLCIGLVRLAAAQPPSGQAQDIAPLTPQRHYNGIVAGEEAYLANDARRQAELGRQVNLSADMYWRWSGASSWYPGVFEAWPLVPGEIVGYSATAAPPRVSPTSVRYSPLAPWAAGPGPGIGTRAVIRRPRGEPVAIGSDAAVPKPVERPVAASVNPSPANPSGEHPSTGILPGFVPQAEEAAGGDSRPSSGPRAF